jgi:hypothetical protein
MSIELNDCIRMKGLFLALFASAALSCRSTAGLTGEQVFKRVESRLMAAKRIDVAFEASATGPVQSKATGNLKIDGSDVAIEGSGAMKGVNTTVRFTTNDTNRPADIRHAVVIGWTRMGLLHNLVRLLGDQNIEHDSGGIEDWVAISDISWNAQERKLIFDIDVEGQQIAVAHLWLTPDGLPLRRTQTVHFPGGDMVVEEHYQWH